MIFLLVKITIKVLLFLSIDLTKRELFSFSEKNQQEKKIRSL